MGILALRDAYAALTAEQKQLLQEKRLSAQHSLAEWEALLTQVDEFDRLSDVQRENAGTFAGLAIMAGLVGLGYGIFRAAVPWDILGGLVFACGIGLGAHVFFAESLNLPPGPRSFVLGVVKALRPLAPPGLPAALEFDLDDGISRWSHRERRRHRSGIANMEGPTRAVDDYYNQALLSGTIDLADRSRLQFKVVNDFLRTRDVTVDSDDQRRQVTTRYRTETRMELMLTWPYVHPGVQADAGGVEGDRFNVEVGETGTRVHIQRTLTVFTAQQPAAESFLGFLADARKRLGAG